MGLISVQVGGWRESLWWYQLSWVCGVYLYLGGKDMQSGKNILWFCAAYSSNIIIIITGGISLMNISFVYRRFMSTIVDYNKNTGCQVRVEVFGNLPEFGTLCENITILLVYVPGY
jgi:hypothetical protein